MAGNEKLPDEVKEFIVRALASYIAVAKVIAAVKDEFGLVLERQHVHSYDAGKPAGKHLSAKLKTLFEATRKAWIEEAGQVPIAHPGARLQMLWRMAQDAEREGNKVLAASLLEQAARDMGGAYEGRHGGRKAEDTPDPNAVAQPRDIGVDRMAAIGAKFAKGLVLIEGGGAAATKKKA